MLLIHLFEEKGNGKKMATIINKIQVNEKVKILANVTKLGRSLTTDEVSFLKRTIYSKHFIPFENDYYGLTAMDFKILNTRIWAEHIKIDAYYGENDEIFKMTIFMDLFEDKTSDLEPMSDHSLVLAHAILEL